MRAVVAKLSSGGVQPLMHTLARLALACLVLLVGPPEPLEDHESMSLDDLIKRLPPAGRELTADRAQVRAVEAPASLEMARRLAIGTQLTDDQWREALRQTGGVRLREKWPADMQYRVSMAVPRWLGVAQIRLFPRVDGWPGMQVGDLYLPWSDSIPGMDRRDARAGRMLGEVPVGTNELVFDVEVERGESSPFAGDYGPPAMLWRGTISTRIELVESFDQVVTPIDNELLAEAVRDAVGAGTRQWGSEPRPIPFVLVDPDCSRFPELKETALDLELELLNEGEVVAKSWLVASDIDELNLLSSIRTGPVRFYGSANLGAVMDVQDRTGWVIRLIGRSEHVRWLWHAKRHWSGVVTIPWAEAVRHEAKRVAPHGRGPEMGTPRWQ